MKYSKTTNKDKDFSSVVKAILFGASIGAIVCAVFLFVFAFLFVSIKSVPQFMVQIIAVFCAAIGAFVSGYIAAKISRFNGLIYGTLSGFSLFLMLTLIAFIISRDKFTYITLVRLLSMLLSGAIGGVLGVNKKRRK